MCEKFYLLVLSICISFILCGASPAFSQDSEAENDEFTLEEITVTAQKREENLQKVPIAMQVISGGEMQELGHDNVDEILAYVGNIVINKNADGYRVAMRGVTDDFGVFNGLTTSTPTVAISTDGVYSSRNDQGMGLYDVERMEVLFGPQSTMYANTSPGGIINVVTAAPKLDTYAASGTLEYGNFDYLHTEGSINVPVSAQIALRGAFSTSVRDGYLSNGGDDEDTKSARLKLLYQPTESLSVTLTGEHSLENSYGFSSVAMFADQDDVDDPWYTDDELGDPSNQKQDATNANISWDAGFGTVTVVPSYSKTTSSQLQSTTQPGATEATVQHMDFEQTEKAAELRMVSSDDFFFKWNLGFNYYKSDNWSFTTTEDSKEEGYQGYWNDSKALYANVTYPLVDSFRVTAGIRKNWSEMTTHSETLNSATSTLSGPGGSGSTDTGTTVTTQNADGTYDIITDLVQEYPDTDFKFGVEYDYSENSMLYADVSTSYRMQGQGMANSKGEYPPPEEMTAFSLGAKNRFFDNRVQLNISAYWYEYKNKFASGNPTWFIYMWEDDARILGAVDPDTGEALNYSFVDNNGDTQYGIDLNGDGELNNEANPGDRGMPSLSDSNRANWGDYRSRGIDLQMNWIITDRDRLDVSYSYMNNEWLSLYYEYEYNWIYDPVDYSGKSNINSPEHSVTATYSHNFPLANGGSFTARFDTKYQSEFFISFKELDSPYRDQEAYHISNLNLIYTNPDSKWTLTGYVKNIEDYAVKRSLNGVGESETGFVYEMMVGSPRTYGAVLSIRF